MDVPVIELNDVSLSLNGHLVLRDVSLSVRKGNFLALIGPNGGGKTTLLRLMLGLQSPNTGIIRVFGKAPLEVSHRIGYVPQDVHINKRFPISARDVVLMGKLKPGMGRGRPSAADREAAEQALTRLGMTALGDRHIGNLSGGQRQRVFIARALVSEPEILLLRTFRTRNGWFRRNFNQKEFKRINTLTYCFYNQIKFLDISTSY